MWTGFNTLRNENSILRECSIGYCQVIEASPTELSTVYTVLQRSLQIADQLGQHDVIIVLDQAIYAKALEVLWQNKDQFQRLVVRLGSFHTICAFFAAIGKQFGDTGLADVLMESGIVASGSVAGVIMLDSLYDEVLISTDSNRFYVYFRLCLKHCTDCNDVNLCMLS